MTSVKKIKVLITGFDGQIAHFVKERYTSSNYEVYGISKPNSVSTSQNIFNIDLTDLRLLEKTLDVVKPDIIIHLAGISNSQEALANPILTLNTNGMVTAYLCDIIHRKGWKTKLFNSSSSEIFKGHIDYIIKEDDHNMYHLHPYSIAKTLGHNMIEFYRQTYDLPFSNGIIFTTESTKRKDSFLLNKVSSHIKAWNEGVKIPLRLGSLDSSRNLLHASDVANAIFLIMEQDRGDTYLISNLKSEKVYDMVITLYKLGGITLSPTPAMDGGEDIILKDENHMMVVIVSSKGMNEAVPVNIQGYPAKLLKLGWTPHLSIRSILKEKLES